MSSMRVLISSAALVGAVGVGSALADQHVHEAPPVSKTTYPFPIGCSMGSGDVVADVLVKNNKKEALAPGTKIHWKTDGGASGVANTGRLGLGPGKTLTAGQAPYPFTCTASIAKRTQ